MKLKTVFCAGLTGLMLLATACTSETLEDPLTRTYETYEGELKSLGSIRVNAAVTHLFETEEGDILYAYSDRYDLDDEEYFGLNVEAYGPVMSYEGLDKELFEIQRLEEIADEPEIASEVSFIDYQDSELGFSLSYPDNWNFNALRDSIKLEAPTPDFEDEVEGYTNDYMVVAKISDAVTTSSQDEDAARIQEIESLAEYAGQGFVSELNYIGQDRQFALAYHTDEYQVTYLVPRKNELFEISFFNPSGSDGGQGRYVVEHYNTFSDIVNGFRFIPSEDESDEEEPAEDELESEEEVVTETEVEVEVEENEAPKVQDPSPVDQVYVDDYREFESNPFSFRISYPADWYYSGGNSGYSFADEPIEDDTEPILLLELNARTAEGTLVSEDQTELTVLVGERFYTLSGPSEYLDVMQNMANSIELVEPDEEA